MLTQKGKELLTDEAQVHLTVEQLKSMDTDTHLYVRSPEDPSSWNVQVFRSIDSGEQISVDWRV
jgi:hypothetical protein